jgi:nicotinate-nucleotide adenylyltransferase
MTGRMIAGAWPRSGGTGRGKERAAAVPDTLPRFGDRRNVRIGVLGGSFNPAHAGHLHIARLALRRCGLDQVWLLVSPGNPLKDPADMAPLATRLASARKIADGRHIVATAIEQRLHTRYTLDTLRALRRLFPRAHFVWLMGADNLSQLPRWRGWMGIVRMVPFAVLPRPTYNHRALAGHAARRLRAARHVGREAPAIVGMRPPAWVFLPAPQDPSSATAMRKACRRSVT